MANPSLTLDVAADAAAAVAQFTDLSGAVDGVGGAARQSSSYLDTAAGSIDKFGSAAADAAGKAASVGDAVDGFGGSVGDVSSALSGIAPAVEAAGFGGFAQALDTATIALDAVEGATMLFTTAQEALNAIQSIGSARTIASTVAMGAQAAVMGVVRGATIAWTAVQWLLNAALTANPIGIVVVLIAALVAAIVIAWKKSDTFRAVVMAAWNGIKAAIAAVVKWIQATIPPLWDRIKLGAMVLGAAIIRAWQTIRAAIALVLNWIRATVTAVFAGIRAAALAFQNTNRAVWSAIKAAVQSVLDWIKRTVGAVFGAVRDAAGVLRSVLVSAWDRIKAAVSPVLNVLDRVKGAIQSVIDWIGRVHIPNWLSKLTGVQASGFGPAPAAAFTAPGVSSRSAAGTSRTGGGAVVVNVSVPATANPAETGRQIVAMIRAFERSSGTRWRA